MQDKTYSDKDLIRIYQKHLDFGEREAVEAFFAGTAAPFEVVEARRIAESIAQHRMTVLKADIAIGFLEDVAERLDTLSSEPEAMELDRLNRDLGEMITELDAFRREFIFHGKKLNIPEFMLESAIIVLVPVRSTLRFFRNVSFWLHWFTEGMPDDIRHLRRELDNLQRQMEALSQYLED